MGIVYHQTQRVARPPQRAMLYRDTGWVRPGTLKKRVGRKPKLSDVCHELLR